MTSPIGIYVRVSRQGDREDERFHSPQEQAERASSLAVARGYTPGPIFEDIDVSGATPPADRPAMASLLARVESGELGGVTAYSLDRLSREPAHGDELVRRITRAGGVVLTPDIPEAIDSPTGEFTFGMLLQVAKLYRSQAKARFADAKERAILAGIPVGPPPVGYRRGLDRRLEVDPEMAPVVRSLFERYAAGATQGSLLSSLDEATGRKWSRQAIPQIIRNRVYATGRLTYGDIVSEWATEPIVDEALWHAAQRAPRPLRPPRSAEGWLLSGLLRCAACGNCLSPQRIRPYRRKSDGHVKEYRAYRCTNRACVGRAHVMASLVEPWVELKSFDTVEAVVSSGTVVELGPLEAELRDAERRLEQVLGPEAQDAMGDAWAATVKTRRAARDTAAAALGDARNVISTPGIDTDLREIWPGLNTRDRRAVLALLWKSIDLGRPLPGGQRPVRFVARGPLAEVELELPTQ